MGKAERKARKQARRLAKDLDQAPPVGVANRPLRSRWRVAGVLLLWLVAVSMVTATFSWILFAIDRPAADERSTEGQIRDDINSYFSMGFDRQDLTNALVLEDDQAMTLTWSRGEGDRGIVAEFAVGPYHITDFARPPSVVVMAPLNASLTSCSITDLFSQAPKQGGASLALPTPSGCFSHVGKSARFVTASLLPYKPASQDAQYYLHLDFTWSNPAVLHQGIGRESVQMRYQGKLTVDPEKTMVPADVAKLRYDTSGSGRNSGLARGVLLKYSLRTGETLTSSDPPPDFTGNGEQVWVSDSQRPTYILTLTTENSRSRRIYDLASQGVFLLVGAIIGANVPSLRRRTSD